MLKVTCIGSLGRDPEVRYLPSGMAVCNFSVASTERWKDKASGEKKERTFWLRCSAFDRLAEVCGEYLFKGSKVYVEGTLQEKAWTDKDGIERSGIECRVGSMEMLGSPPENDERPARAAKPAEATPARSPAQRASGSHRPAAEPSGTGFDDMADDIPF